MVIKSIRIFIVSLIRLWLLNIFPIMPKGSRRKVLFLVAGPLTGGGGLNRCATKEKRKFFNVRKEVLMSNKPRVEGLKALVAGPLKKELFLAASLKYQDINVKFKIKSVRSYHTLSS